MHAIENRSISSKKEKSENVCEDEASKLNLPPSSIVVFVSLDLNDIVINSTNCEEDHKRRDENKSSFNSAHERVILFGEGI